MLPERLLAAGLLLAAIGCMRVKGLPYEPIRPPEREAASATSLREKTLSLELTTSQWQSLHSGLAGRFALASSREIEPGLPAGTVRLAGAVSVPRAEVPAGGQSLGPLLFDAGHPTEQADYERIAVIEGGRVWWVDWWNLSDGSLRGCPLRVGGGSFVIVMPLSRYQDGRLPDRLWRALGARLKAGETTDSIADAAAGVLGVRQSSSPAVQQ